MPFFSRLVVVASVSYATVQAARDRGEADLLLHQQAFEDRLEDLEEEGCARSCHIMDPDFFWLHAAEPDVLRAKADENCVNEHCKGCRRITGGRRATTMPDCSKEPTPIVQPVDPEPAPIAPSKIDEPVAPALDDDDDDVVVATTTTTPPPTTTTTEETTTTTEETTTAEETTTNTPPPP